MNVKYQAGQTSTFAASVGFAAALIASVGLLPSGARAATIINGSFESSPLNPGGGWITLTPGNPALTGWTIDSGSIDYVGGYWQAADGSRSVDLNGGETGSISQTITGLIAGQEYMVSFELAGNPDGDPAVKTLNVITASAGSTAFSFDVSGDSRPSMGWMTYSLLFTATGPSELLRFTSTISGFYGPVLDNVSVTATPVPAALPLFASALGLGGFFGYRRKRKR